MPKLLIYVSGHGFGHAGRTAQLIQALVAAAMFEKIVVRTSAPSWLFKINGSGSVSVNSAEIDVGVRELDARRVDVESSKMSLIRYFSNYDEMLEHEVRLVRSMGFNLILADVPFIAGDVSHFTNVPAVAISNFLWDWIYADKMFSPKNIGSELERMTRAYGRFSLYLRLPFHPAEQSISRVVDVPIISGERSHSDSAVQGLLKVDFARWRSVVFFTFRSSLAAGAMTRILQENSDTLFLWAAPVPSGFMPVSLNFCPVPDGGPITFQDLVAVADSVVAKLGYGTIAACAAEGTQLLYVDRFAYPEDGPLIAGTKLSCTAAQITSNDFETGAWRSYLDSGLGEVKIKIASEKTGAKAYIHELGKLL